MKKLCALFVVSSFSMSLIAMEAFAVGPTFSTDGMSEMIFTGTPNTIPDNLHNAGVGGVPIAAPPVDLPGAGGLNVDAFHFGIAASDFANITGYFFSVDRLSRGLAGTAVRVEATPFASGPPPPHANDVGQSSDIFASDGASGASILFFDDDGTANSATGFNGSGIPNGAPALGLLNNGDGILGNGDSVAFGTWETHDVDGIDMRDKDDGGLFGSIFFSVDSPSAGAYAGGSGAAIYVSPLAPAYDAATPLVYASPGALGLAAADDLDALVVFDALGDATFGVGDTVLFSLATGSVSLGPLAATPDDILIATFGGPTSVHVDGALLGLSPGLDDNLNALDVEVIPEPAAIGFILLGMAVLGRRIRSMFAS